MGMRINGQLPTPEEIKSALPMSPYLKKIKAKRDGELKDIFLGKDNRFIVVVGPCSADNIDSVLEYVRRLAEVNQKVKDRLFIIPRVYTNKPRTTGEGYKGMLHQPEPDKAPNLHEGILAIRQMHLKVIAESGLTSADEMLYPENRSYLDDVLSYEAVGARSVENQQHRLVASGMDIPVGMKNPTSGDFTVMLNSVLAAQKAHNFIYRGYDVTTDGNPLAHVILRGGVNKHGNNIPNYHYEDMMRLKNLYEKIENDIVGMETSTGIKITGQSKHFMERVIGTKEDPKTHRPRSGVDIGDIQDALIHGTLRTRSRDPDSIKYVTDKCIVSVNPKTGTLIQCNPR